MARKASHIHSGLSSQTYSRSSISQIRSARSLPSGLVLIRHHDRSARSPEGPGYLLMSRHQFQSAAVNVSRTVPTRTIFFACRGDNGSRHRRGIRPIGSPALVARLRVARGAASWTLRSIILSISPRSSQTPRHVGQKSISTPKRSDIVSPVLHTGHGILRQPLRFAWLKPFPGGGERRADACDP